MPTVVSLCMIVRNEEEHIGACLAAAQPYADEMIVVDTGSQDRTAAIAEQHGAKLYRMKWNDHFAEARNYAMKRASGSWILVLDADERLHPADPELFRRCIADEAVGGYLVTIRHHRSDLPDDYETDSVCRLFRNLPGLAYRGRVHEDIGMALSSRYPELAIVRSELVVSHYGYLRRVAQAKDKAARNRKLLERAVREENDPYYYRYATGVESFLQEQYPEAASELAPLLPLVPPSAGYAADLAYKLAYAYWRSGQTEAALRAAEMGIVRDPLQADLQELHGVLLLESGRPEEARHRLARFAAADSFSDDRQRGRLHYWQGLVHAQLGNWREAAACLERCLHSGLYREQALPRWLDLALLVHPIAEVLSKLEAALHGVKTADVLAALGRYAVKWGLGGDLLPLLESAERAEEAAGSRELSFLRAVMMAQTGETEAADGILQQLIRDKPERHVILYLWALHNIGAESQVQLNLLYGFPDTEPGLAAFADLLLRGEPVPEALEPLAEQAAYAMLTMGAWSGFLLVWQHARADDVPRAWRPAVYRSPAPVRAAVWHKWASRIGEDRHGQRLFAAQLAYSLGNKEACKRLFEQLKRDLPQRLEPRIGLYGLYAGSDEWAPFLFGADL